MVAGRLVSPTPVHTSLWQRVRHKIVGLALGRTRKMLSSLPPSSPTVYGMLLFEYHVSDEHFCPHISWSMDLFFGELLGSSKYISGLSTVSTRMFTERTKTKGEHFVLGVAVRAGFNAERHSQNQAQACRGRGVLKMETESARAEFAMSSPSGLQCRAAPTHPFSDHAGPRGHAEAKWAK